MVRTLSALPLSLAAVLAVGCRQAPSGSGAAAAPPPPPAVDERLVDANTRFAFSLFDQLHGQSPEGNAFLSPASVAMALHMTYNGAGTTTKAAMAEALAVTDLSLGDLNAANLALRRGLEQPGPGVDLALANSMWQRMGCPFAAAFVQANHEFYGATLQELDFGDPAAPETIDQWVRDETHGRIESITPDPIPSDPPVTLIIVSAAYFRGEWAEPFERSDTKPGTFHRPDGTTREILMMLRQEDMDYLRSDGFQAVHLPYGTGRFGMLIFLPDRGRNLAEFCERLAPEEWPEWRGSFHEAEVHLKLPRFRVEWGASLREPLSALGMDIAFDPDGADFAAMEPDRARRWIHDVLHKAFIEVNEEGTEAAAATEVLMQQGEDTEGPRQVIVDRPFLCAIVDNETDAILFIGAIVDPEPA